MSILEILKEAIGLERSIKTLYSNKAASMNNPQSESMLRMLASESEAHARQLESRCEAVGETKPTRELTKELLALVGTRIDGLKQKSNPLEIIQNGIEIEEYLAKVYDTVADVLESEEQALELAGELNGESSKAGQVIRGIAVKESEHAEILRKIATRMAGYGFSW